MEKAAYDAQLCELLGVRGPVGFTNPQDGSMLEVWKLPNGGYVYLTPSDMLSDSQRAAQFQVVVEQVRCD
jgi:hypothetical protein